MNPVIDKKISRIFLIFSPATPFVLKSKFVKAKKNAYRLLKAL